MKHFTERDIAQQADRKTGQKAKLRYGSTPRLLLEPLKAETGDKEHNGEPKAASENKSVPSEVQSVEGPSSIAAVIDPQEKRMENTQSYKCLDCGEIFITSGHLFNHSRERHKRKRPRLKTSDLLKTLKPSEVLVSSESDCEYEVTINVKRIPKSTKRAHVEQKKVENLITAPEPEPVPVPVEVPASAPAPVTLLDKEPDPITVTTPVVFSSPNSKAISVSAPVTANVSTTSTLLTPKASAAPAKQQSAAKEKVILITVPTEQQPQPVKPPRPKPTPIPMQDDLEDMLTSSLIMKPKKAAEPRRLVSKFKQPPTKLKQNNVAKTPEEKSFTNIMIASINSDGQIVEQCVEAFESDIIQPTPEDINHLIEEDYTETEANEGQEVVQPSPVREKPKPVAETPPPTQSEADSDDEAGDGAIRKCFECKMCKWMFLSTKKIKKHLTDVHRLMMVDKDVSMYTKSYPYKNIKPTNGVRAFACSVCLRMYSNVNALKKHQIIQHSSVLGLDEKPVETKATPQDSSIHVCHVCRKSFLDPENLRSHLLLHVDGKTEDSMYKCDQCGLGFEYEAALTKHTIENHATLRLYSCEYCNDAFASSADLFEHVQEHVSKNDQPTNTTNEGSNISELYLACPEDNCDLAFKDSNSYYWHILYEHRKVYQDDPKFIEFLQMVDPDTLTQEGSNQEQPEAETPPVEPAEEETNKKSQITYADPSMRFTCKLCDRKVKQRRNFYFQSPRFSFVNFHLLFLLF